MCGQRRRCRDLLAPLTTSSYLAKWVAVRPPYPYDEGSGKDMWFWQELRQSGLKWVRSLSGRQFAVGVYQKYEAAFTDAVKNSDGKSVQTCLEAFYEQRVKTERQHIRAAAKESLLTHTTGCENVQICVQGRDIVDCFSFVVRPLQRAIFQFFGEQVRVSKEPTKRPQRFKDREDHAKTYYVGGCVLNDVKKLVKRRSGKDATEFKMS